MKRLLVAVILLACAINGFSADLVLFRYRGLYGYVDTNLKVIVKPRYPEATDFVGGFATVRKKETLCALIDSRGNEVFEYTDEGYTPDFISDGLIGFERDGRYGFYDLSGTVVLSGYELAHRFYEGITVIRDQGRYWFIDKKGNKLFQSFFRKTSFDEAAPFFEGVARVGVRKDGVMHYGYIDTSGRYVIEPKYQELDRFFSHGLCKAVAKVEDGVEDIIDTGYLNKQGEWQIPPLFYDGRVYSGRVALVRYKKAETKRSMDIEGWKLVDGTGTDVKILDEKIQIESDFSEGMASFSYVVNDELKYGCIDERGEIVIPPLFYDPLSDFRNGFAFGIYNGQDVLVDRTGQITPVKDILNR